MSRVQRRPRPPASQGPPSGGRHAAQRREGFHEYIPIGELHIDSTYQRDINYPFITEMAADFDYGQLDLQSFSVGRRMKGQAHTDYIIDGQHRWLALSQREPKDFPVGCYVRISPGADWEANEYLRINFARKNPTSAGRFKAAVTAGRSFGWDNDAAVAEMLTELEIQTVQHTGQTYTPRGGGHGNAVPTLFAIGKVCRLYALYPEVVRRVLITMRDTWADTRPSQAFDGIVFDGLADFYMAHHEEAVTEEVVRVLRPVPPSELRDGAEQLRGNRKYPVRAFVARSIAELYNQGKRGATHKVRDVTALGYITARLSMRASAVQARRSPEERSAITRKGVATMSAEQRSERTRKGQATRTPEVRSEAARLASRVRDDATLTDLRAEMVLLKQRKEQAIESEDYEAAATLRTEQMALQTRYAALVGKLRTPPST